MFCIKCIVHQVVKHLFKLGFKIFLIIKIINFFLNEYQNNKTQNALKVFASKINFKQTFCIVYKI